MPSRNRNALEPGKVYHVYILLRVKDEPALNEFALAERAADAAASIPTRAFQALFTAYTQAINKARGRTGRLFAEHFGRIEVASDRYFTNLIHYIHFNPQKHGFVTDFRDWEWSSYTALNSTATTKLARKEVLNWFGGALPFEEFHRGAIDEPSIRALIADDFA